MGAPSSFVKAFRVLYLKGGPATLKEENRRFIHGISYVQEGVPMSQHASTNASNVFVCACQ